MNSIHADIAELCFETWKIENPHENEHVARCVEERTTKCANKEMVVHVALSRYFQLLLAGRQSLKGMFTAREMVAMLNVNPQEWWTESLWGESVWNVPDAIYSEHLDDQNHAPEAAELFDKVQRLNFMQRLALVDVLECGWRSCDPLDYVTHALELAPPSAENQGH